MRRWSALLLLLLAVFTLAPRTSWGSTRWQGYVLGDTFGTNAATKTLVVTVVPPEQWDSAEFVIEAGNTDWTLVSSTPGCRATPGRIGCDMENTGADRQRHIRVTVRTPTAAPLGYTLSVEELEEE